MWNINDSIFGFTEKMSCQAACHAGEPGKPFGNKYTGDETELGDIWHMKTVRTGSVGQLDNQYVDSTHFDPVKSPDAGRKSDANTGGGYTDMKLVDGKPEFMNKDGKAGQQGRDLLAQGVGQGTVRRQQVCARRRGCINHRGPLHRRSWRDFIGDEVGRRQVDLRVLHAS